MEWYEELDYDENPFMDNEDTELIGYDNVIDEVLYRLESGNMVCVEGSEGAGKTAVLKAILNKFKGTGKLVYLNGTNFSNGLNIEKVFNKKAGIMKRLFGKKPHNLILLLDEVQNLSKKNCERLKYYYDNNFVKSVVFTSSNFNQANFTPSLKERISKTIYLREISEDEAIDIVQSRLGSDEIMPEEVIKEVFKRSDRNMKKFLENCNKLCEFAFRNNGKVVELEHVKEVFGENEFQPKVEEKDEEDSLKRKDSQNKKAIKKKKKTKKTNKKTNKKAKEESETINTEEPINSNAAVIGGAKSAVNEPITISTVDDFKPEKKEEKMEDEFKDEEIDIDAELKKLKESKIDEDEDLLLEDYEEDYDDFKEDDEEDGENVYADDVAEKYY